MIVEIIAQPDRWFTPPTDYATIMVMITIDAIKARQILDSRGYPTVECDVVLSDGATGRAAVPSGASTGAREAVELRDGGASYGGKGVTRAIAAIDAHISPLLVGKDPFDQRAIDQRMTEADATPNKSRFGANAILAVSLATAKAAAVSSGLALHDYVAALAGTSDQQSLPMPMVNIVNGGSHAGFATDIQEYMIIPVGAADFRGAMAMSSDIFHALAKVLAAEGLPTTVGDEGGYALHVDGGNRAAFDFILRAVQLAGYDAGSDVVLAVDVAASEFYHSKQYVVRSEGSSLTSASMIDYLEQLVHDYPIVSIEDGLDEADWSHWVELNSRIGEQVQLVGDDLLVTNVELLEKAITDQAANAILIKPNQIGSLSETIDAVLMAKQHDYRTIISHRSGETEDVTIAHLAVGLGAGQIKTGSMSRSERLAKYNELLRIAERSPRLQLARPFDRDQL